MKLNEIALAVMAALAFTFPMAHAVTPNGKEGTTLEGADKPRPTREGERTPNASESRPAASEAAARTSVSAWDPHELKPAPGGGHGKVWVNTQTRVYHCEGDPLYGRTKKGGYMAEAAARQRGNQPLMGKTCGG